MNLGYAIPRDIVIKASSNMGFIVKIGCGTFVAASKQELLNGIEEYIFKPNKWEKEYNSLPGNPEVAQDIVEPSSESPRPRGTLAEAEQTDDQVPNGAPR